MKKIDLYILKKILSTFVFVVFLLVLIICVIDFTEKNDDFMQNDVSRAQIFKYYLTLFPYFAILLTPITAFIATVFVTAKMAAQTEIVAILASGVSFRRMLLPYLVAATIIAAFSFSFMGYVIPDANKYRINFELTYLKKPFFYSDRNIHLKIGENDYIYIDRYNNQRDIGYTVTLERIVDERLEDKITAKRIHWDTATNKWSLKNWQRREVFDDYERITSDGAASDLDTMLNLTPADFQNKERLQETLTLPELNDYIALQQSRGADDVGLYQIEKYIRYMQPFGVIILCFIGVVVSAKKSRRGTGFQIALGFLIAFVFIIFFILARAIAEAGSMNPIFAVWIPNIIFSCIGLLLYNTVPR
ncbi:LptF/LptG family permease [Marinoscillum furvescens]|uniref:Lipopolysaccharide export system permease protein n=1 Tax=Marinoscillum furvescens DSM 4134 TaxID=1122208 RepID=A0A3D9KY95_MARFU|nr:LptF/LptG family permease [Marinoscillum furvescens]RED93372.1 lipopolysaccharide export system permease protein [Marinoscillum furvescens DSM 4134]